MGIEQLPIKTRMAEVCAKRFIKATVAFRRIPSDWKRLDTPWLRCKHSNIIETI